MPSKTVPIGRLPVGTRFRQPSLGIEGTVIYRGPGCTRVRLSRADGKTHNTEWSPTVEVAPVSENSFKERTMSESTTTTTEATETKTAPTKTESKPAKKAKQTKATKAPTASSNGERVSRQNQILKALVGTTSGQVELTRPEIAKESGNDNKTGSTCNELKEKGLINFSTHEGSRGRAWYLTAKGKTAAAKL